MCIYIYIHRERDIHMCVYTHIYPNFAEPGALLANPSTPGCPIPSSFHLSFVQIGM